MILQDVAALREALLRFYSGVKEGCPERPE